MKKSCPKCQCSMTEGFLLNERDGGKKVSRWIEGAPVRSFWGLKLRGKRYLDVQTFRCERCGLLESYAPE